MDGVSVVTYLPFPTFVYSYFIFLIFNSSSLALEAIECALNDSVFSDKMEAKCAIGQPI